MQARAQTVYQIDGIILGGSTATAIVSWIALSFLQTVGGIDFGLLEKFGGAGIAGGLMFLLLKWALKRNDEQARRMNELQDQQQVRLNEIHDQQQARLNALYEERLKEMKEALEALKHK